jgi:5-methylcytosine-specific restriction endonuclease McrA
VIKKGKHITTVAHLGRHVPAEVMTALIVGGRECSVEGCHNRGYLERDHIHDYAKGGPTSYKNICYLCWGDHDKKSKGWILSEPDPVTGKRKLRPPPARAG